MMFVVQFLSRLTGQLPRGNGMLAAEREKLLVAFVLCVCVCARVYTFFEVGLIDAAASLHLYPA